MDLKINREAITISECIFEGVQEQSVELDYILPDYYPDIFKLVKCCVTPSVMSKSINGDSISYELLADIKILYCSEKSNVIQCISQKQRYTKTVQLGESPEKPEILIIPKTDHINCRAVNQRRIDMQCAVSVKVHVCGERTQDVICDIFGMNAQMKKIPIEYASKKISVDKSVTLNEDIELNESKPPILSIIRCEALTENTDQKIVSGKLVAKGDTSVKVLYSCENGMETMQFNLPYSQIIDMDGLDEGYICNVKAEIAYCDVTAYSGNNDDSRTLRCELRISLNCTAVKSRPAMLVSDVYSTVYPCEFASSRLKIEQIPKSINELFRHSFQISCDEGTVEAVYDAWCTPKNLNIRTSPSDKTIVISGMLSCCVMVKNENGRPSVIEKDEAFEQAIPADAVTEGSSADINAEVTGCSYTINSENSISVKAEIRLNGSLCTSSLCEAVTDVRFDESLKKSRDGDYALKLYFCEENEDVWDIAKRYSTSVNAIMEENDLEKEKITDSRMLLIPIV
ncbi:MAG: SPOCS domain-containing protein [Porcipelethomonas sp.]